MHLFISKIVKLYPDSADEPGFILMNQIIATNNTPEIIPAARYDEEIFTVMYNQLENLATAVWGSPGFTERIVIANDSGNIHYSVLVFNTEADGDEFVVNLNNSTTPTAFKSARNAWCTKLGLSIELLRANLEDGTPLDYDSLTGAFSNGVSFDYS